MSKDMNEQRAKLLLRESSEDVLKKLEDDPKNPDLWYSLGVSLSDEKGFDEGIDAFSQGIAYSPFNASLYFARGRKYIGLQRFWRSISDLTLAIRLDPDKWSHWYYRAVCYNLNKCYEESIYDLHQCLRLTEEEEHYPLVDWLFHNYVDMGEMEKAKAVLDLIDADVVPPTMDYGYRRQVLLYKGIISPEELIDLEDIKKNSLVKDNVPGRMELETTSITIGHYVYYTYIGDTEKANEALLKITTFEPSAAFAYLKGVALAKERGLID